MKQKESDMARNYDNDSKPKFPWARNVRLEGNLVEDPREIKGGGAAIKVAANYRSYDGTERVFYVSGIAWGGYGAWALENLRKGQFVAIIGDLYGHEWEDRDGNTRQDVDVEIAFIGENNRWFEDGGNSDRGRRSSRSSGGSRSARRSRDDDDDDENMDDEERPVRRRRAAPSRNDDDGEDRPVRRRRSARTVGDE